MLLNGARLAGVFFFLIGEKQLAVEAVLYICQEGFQITWNDEHGGLYKNPDIIHYWGTLVFHERTSV